MFLALNLGGWIVRFILAVLVYVLIVIWPVHPLLDQAVVIPQVVYVLVGLLVAAIILFSPYWYGRIGTPAR